MNMKNYICYLHVQTVLPGTGFKKIICAPFNGRTYMGQLACGMELFVISESTPSQSGNSKSHWQSIFHIVSCIIISPNKVHLKQVQA